MRSESKMTERFSSRPESDFDPSVYRPLNPARVLANAPYFFPAPSFCFASKALRASLT